MKNKYNIETEEFCCESSLLQDALDTLGYIYKQKKDDYASIGILCNEDLTEKIIKRLNVICAIGDIDLDIDYIDFDKEDYDNDYGIVLSVSDGQLTLGIEKAYCGNGEYKLFDFDYLYISDECNGDLILKHIKTEIDIDIFTITDECEDKFDNEEFDEDKYQNFEENMELCDLVYTMVEDILSEKFSR